MYLKRKVEANEKKKFFFAPFKISGLYSAFGLTACGTAGQNPKNNETGVSVASIPATPVWTATSSFNPTPTNVPNATPQPKNVWIPIGPYGGIISTLALDPSNTSTLYAGTNGGIFKTNDGAAHWMSMSSGLDGIPITAFAIDPINSSVVYAGREIGVYKSADGGANWLPSSAGIPINSMRINSLAVDQIAPSIVYAGTREGLFRSIDGGATWKSVNTGLTAKTITRTAIDPQKTSTLYAATFDGGMFKSDDGGANWRTSNKGLQNIGHIKSVTTIATIEINPKETNILFIATYGFAFKSIDGGESRSVLDIPLPRSSTCVFAINPGNPTKVYSTTPDIILKSNDGGETWNQVSKEFEKVGFVSNLVIDPENPSTLYASTVHSATRGDGALYKSIDGGEKWRDAQVGLSATVVQSLAVDPNNPNIVLAGASVKGVMKTFEVGGSWMSLMEADTVGALAIDPSNSMVYFAGIINFISRSLDGGDHWTWVDISAAGGNAYIHALVIHPTDSKILFAGTDNGLLQSNDGGITWNKLIGIHVSCLVIDPLHPDTLFAGTNQGVYKSVDGGHNLKRKNNGLGITTVLSLAIDPQNPATLFAGTFNGVFMSLDGVEKWDHILVGNDAAAIVHAIIVNP
jgi:photosystem II stability/assembly factor-like uncharacterized protein